MTTFNPLAMILNEKLMDESNYCLWKTNLYIVFEFEKIKFVLTSPKPQEPVATASEAIKTQYADWQQANTAARCYILTSIVNHLQQQISSLETGVEMIQTLDEMFRSSARQSAIRALMYTRMTGKSVREHCLAMMSHINHAEMMGAKLEQEMQVDIILVSLPDSFKEFIMIYNMNKLKLTPTQLMLELESAEESLAKPEGVYYNESFYKPKRQPKSGNNIKKKGVGLATKPTTMKKSTDKCFKCGQQGH